MKRYAAALLLSLCLFAPALAGTMIPDAAPPPPCDPSVEICPTPDSPNDATTAVTITTVVLLVTPA
ncbi:MAG: hypothetical protein M3348_13295 [Acidobacteriota bacterium]|nr:hypothetical protein [Acidobacteriota bacterium]